jgi:hypothetical protein
MSFVQACQNGSGGNQVARVLSLPKFKAIKDDGTPGVGWKLFSYVSGTSSLQNTYTDQTESVANTNPVIMDSSGQADVWLGFGKAYKLILKDENDVVQWTVDKVNASEDRTFGQAAAQRLNDLRFATGFSGADDGLKMDAAIFDIGVNPGVVVLSPGMSTSESPASTPAEDITLIDLRNPSSSGLGAANLLAFNSSTIPAGGGVQSQLRLSKTTTNPPRSFEGATLQHEFRGALAPSVSDSLESITATAQTAGAITTAHNVNLVGGEFASKIYSTGGNIAGAYGVIGGVATFTDSTTTITDAASVRAGAVSKAGTGVIANAYGLWAFAQTSGSTRNFAIFSEGDNLRSNNVSDKALDSTATIRNIVDYRSDNLILHRPLKNSSGWSFASQANDAEYAAINSGGLKTSRIYNYNGVATVSGGVPAEYATVDLTAQTAAIGTTTLYAVPASGAGQYRLSWNAKVTAAAGTSSTLGALTIVYTDPDGVAITVTAPATSAAGSINTVNTGNSTGTVLLGFPLMLNCKASTNITYAFAYASNAAAAMNYNLHLKLEAL